MELKDILGNIIYGGKDDTINLLEEIAEAILKSIITIGDIKVTNFANEIGEDIKYKNNYWKKISFWYKLKDKESKVNK